MKTTSLPLYLLVFFLMTCIIPESKAEVTLHPWEVYTLSFLTSNAGQNPYADIPASKGGDLLQVIFEGVSGEASGKKITITGFWNGGQEWCINFAPPSTGEWKYTSVSRDRHLNGKKGSLTVVPWSKDELQVNPTRHGFVQVMKSGENPGHYFEYTDGQPFLWIGDTWWNWTKSSIHFDSFKELVDNRAAKGFTIGQLFVPGNGWSEESSMLKDRYNTLDTDHMKRVEEMIRYANSKGITLWIHAWWSREDLENTIGAEKMQRWWRYLIHRLGAYNVVWVLAGEYNMYNYGGIGLDFWKDLGRMIDEEDPYNRIIGVHNTPPFWGGGEDAPQWSTGSVLHNESWLDYNQSQVGHGKYANEMIPLVVSEAYYLTPPKPIVVTEPWYEFTEGNPTGMDIRFAAWSAILSGAAGHTYGGGHVWLADLPESPAGGNSWPREMGYARTTYDYEGAVSMQHLAEFFRQIHWWNMAPHPELLAEYPQPLCLAIPGEEYLAYLRYGGVAKIKTRETDTDDEFVFQWYDPGTGKYYEKQRIKGAGVLTLHCPESYPGTVHYHDWVLHVWKEK